MKVKDVLKITNGKLICGSEEELCEDFSEDTRKIKPGGVFVGFKGEKIDGNELYNKAFESGAKVCILEKEPKEKCGTIILVENTIRAVEKIAEYKRKMYNIPVVAITGSVGKTSTKDIVASVVSKKYKTLKTEENSNNEIGVPLTVLSLKDEEAMVIEMGMDHYGELSRLTQVVKPTIAIITNISASHIGNFGSLENILKAKLEILEGLQGNTVIINNDNELLNKWGKENKEKYNVITYGIKNESDYMAKDIVVEELQSQYQYNGTQITVPICGEQFVLNSLCAIAVGNCFDIPISTIAEGIENFKLSKNRMQLEKGINNSTIINDTYNANCDSMIAAIKYLKSVKNRRKIAVLGDMLALGDFSEDLHKKVGEEIDSSIDYLITVGNYAKYMAEKSQAKNNISFESNNEAIEKIKSIIRENDIILVKASHAMEFINIVKALKEGEKVEK